MKDGDGTQTREWAAAAWVPAPREGRMLGLDIEVGEDYAAMWWGLSELH